MTLFQTFDEKRPPLKSYGTTCDVWIPSIMMRPDRHNEIEINFLKSGSLTYLLNDRHITIREKSIAVFWGLSHHQIVKIDSQEPYFVFTIPFPEFIEWKLPATFVDRILKGDMLIDDNKAHAPYDEYLFQKWIEDFRAGNVGRIEAATLEARGRLFRLAVESMGANNYDAATFGIAPQSIGLVNSMAIYIARNFRKQIKIADIARAANLHADYANAIFKKAFGIPLSKYLIEQRILDAQRKLIVTTDTISEIAYDSGFNSLSRFNDAFLKSCRCSPRDYRKKNQSRRNNG